jgi:hypothetical protein
LSNLDRFRNRRLASSNSARNAEYLVYATTTMYYKILYEVLFYCKHRAGNMADLFLIETIP